jgi:hypothetical protein
MAFSQSTIIGQPTIVLDSADLLVSWQCSATPPVYFQVYAGGKLAYAGQSTRCHLPYPGPLRHLQIEVGTVLSGELHTDFSSSLPAVPGTGDRAVLTWLGGTYLDATGADDVQGFAVFGSLVAGGAVSYAARLATIPAYAGGVPLDGFGVGGFGQGGFGRSAASYTWQSGPLGNGVWSFAIESIDKEGNMSAGHTATVTISVPPNPPAESAPGVRLTRTFSPSTHKATLSWLASP